MAIHIVRVRKDHQVFWGVLENSQVLLLDFPCTTTGDLIELGYGAVDEAKKAAETSGANIDTRDAELLSPITEQAKVLCQGANYRQHIIDSGMDPDGKPFNMFFTKSSASITGPTGAIIKPRHVTLLDYEVELTLVLGKRTTGPIEVTSKNLHEYVAGVCIGNDISARDIQIPQMQFHKGKSYRTFCPLGPVLCLFDKTETHYLNEMQLTLKVNDEVRQQDSTRNLVHKPEETLTEYSQIANFEPGDVLMTGTPSGCALGLPSPLLVKASGLLPETKKWDLFIKGQQRRSQYLHEGDRVESAIASHDGHINLGTQTHVIRNEQ